MLSGQIPGNKSHTEHHKYYVDSDKVTYMDPRGQLYHTDQHDHCRHIVLQYLCPLLNNNTTKIILIEHQHKKEEKESK